MGFSYLRIKSLKSMNYSYLFAIVLSMLLLSSCSNEASENNKSTIQQQAPKVRKNVSVTTPKFERLAPEQTGINFTNRK